MLLLLSGCVTGGAWGSSKHGRDHGHVVPPQYEPEPASSSSLPSQLLASDLGLVSYGCERPGAAFEGR